MRSLDWLTPEQRYAIAQRYLELAIASLPATATREQQITEFHLGAIMHRRPCPFFRSVEFWTIAVKTFAIAPLMLPAILKAGFSLESLLLIAGLISQGVLAALKELESTPNLYTPKGIIGNDLKDAVGNIIKEQVTAIACDSPLTRAQVANSFDPSELVESAVKPSLKKAITTAIAQTLIPKQLRGLF